MPSSSRDVVTVRWSTSTDLISALWKRAGGNSRRDGLVMLVGDTLPVSISAMKPWKVWKLSRLTIVSSTSPRLIAFFSERAR